LFQLSLRRGLCFGSIALLRLASSSWLDPAALIGLASSGWLHLVGLIGLG
jgi:hypothetical protein